MSQPRILIVSLGGTITMTRSDAGGITPTLTADKLIDSVPQLGRGGRPAQHTLAGRL